MFTVFRRPGAKHGYRPALTDLSNDRSSENRAVAFNLMADHRVSPDREAEFHARAGSSPTKTSLKDAVGDYFQSEVRDSSNPAFLRTENENNFVPQWTSPARRGLHPGFELARIINLNGLEKVYIRNRDRLWKELPPPPGKPVPVNYDEFLDQQCRADEKTKERFIEVLFEILDTDRVGNPYEPAWAMAWEDFAPHSKKGANIWWKLAGIKLDRFPVWLAAVKLRAYEAGELFRPTQLDAGWNGFHFPSPPNIVVDSGGHPVDLRRRDPYREVVSEYIFQQSRLESGHWVAAGKLLEEATGKDPGNFRAQRRAHHDVLSRKHGHGAIRRWMPKCV
ncbi:MAG: hypothetical protein EXQ52_05170 [Bryobacterales bacterium]|nr:hypothetical protein [Bryobacterales bacterium]